MYVVERLLDFLFPPRKSEELLRTLPSDGLVSFTSPLSVPLPSGEAVALLSYQTPSVKAAILEAKFHRNEEAWHLLGDVLEEYLLGYAAEEGALRGPSILIPIPLSKERCTERGYNQVEEICRRATLHTGITMDSRILSRINHTVPQTTLSRAARLHNMHGVFIATNVHPAVTYILVDDVTTTGATLFSAMTALTKAGATHIFPLTLAH